MTTALLVIDVQKGMFAFLDFKPHDGPGLLDAIAGLLARARAAGAPVVFVKHNEPGSPLELGMPLHDIADEIAPLAGEPVITKSCCGAFHETNLKQTLAGLGVTSLVICGMQTEFCVNTAVRTAREHGFAVQVAQAAHTTFDNPTLKAPQIIAHHECIWPSQFGPVVPAAEIGCAPQ